jgi:hypothetical protein
MLICVVVSLSLVVDKFFYIYRRLLRRGQKQKETRKRRRIKRRDTMMKKREEVGAGQRRGGVCQEDEGVGPDTETAAEATDVTTRAGGGATKEAEVTAVTVPGPRRRPEGRITTKRSLTTGKRLKEKTVSR